MPFDPDELRKFTSAGHAIAKAAGVAFETWAEGEMGVVLKMWAARTSVITPEKATIEARSTAQKAAFGFTNVKSSIYGITINTGRRGNKPGRVWYRHPSKKFRLAGQIQGDSQFVPDWVHWKDSVWDSISSGVQAYLSELAKLSPAVKKAIGLARQSVIQSADALGIPLERVGGGAVLSGAAIAQARNAIATNGNAYINGTGNKVKTDGQFFVEAVNTYPMNRKLRMDLSLEQVIASRVAYFDRNLEQGVFKELKKVEAKYPYLKVAA